MLWSSVDFKLPNKHFSALVPLKSQKKRPLKDSNLRERYAQTIQEDLIKKFVNKMRNREKTEHHNGREWYLPHHPVMNQNKPG